MTKKIEERNIDTIFALYYDSKRKAYFDVVQGTEENMASMLINFILRDKKMYDFFVKITKSLNEYTKKTNDSSISKN